MKLNSLEELYYQELADLQSAETQLMEALPRFAKAAHSPQLRRAFDKHLQETRGQADRLDTIVNNQLNGPPVRMTCKAMAGLIEEAGEVMESEGEPSVIDAALISQARRIEHYEIAAYGCARAFAAILGEEVVEQLLQESLDEEVAADKKLGMLAASLIDFEAAQA